MTDKTKHVSKTKLYAVAADSPPAAQGEAVLSETHSQDADRHRKTRHPHSDK